MGRRPLQLPQVDRRCLQVKAPQGRLGDVHLAPLPSEIHRIRLQVVEHVSEQLILRALPTGALLAPPRRYRVRGVPRAPRRDLGPQLGPRPAGIVALVGGLGTHSSHPLLRPPRIIVGSRHFPPHPQPQQRQIVIEPRFRVVRIHLQRPAPRHPRRPPPAPPTAGAPPTSNAAPPSPTPRRLRPLPPPGAERPAATSRARRRWIT